MKVHVTVVAIGAHKYDAFVGHGIDELVAQRGAVGCSPLGQSPTVVDDQSLSIRFRDALHPIVCIQC